MKLPNQAEVANPFRIPHMTPDSHQPLRPWEVPEHLAYYVAVDKTEEAFRQFTKETGGAESLLAHGRLAVVLGGQGCGKTSLIHRCANSVHQDLEALQVDPVIVDLSQEGIPNQTIPTRMSHVCSRLVDQLDIENRLDKNFLEELRRRRESPAGAYSYLSAALKSQAGNGDDLVIVVLLPPSDLHQEIIDYSHLIYPRLVFFAESSYISEHSDWRSNLNRSSAAPPIILAVGMLRQEDGFRFARTRLEQHAGDDSPPTVSQGVMEELQTRKPNLTIAQLQRLLCGVYDTLLQEPTPVPEVTIQHIKDYYFYPGMD